MIMTLIGQFISYFIQPLGFTVEVQLSYYIII